MARINHSQKDLSDEITSAKAQVRNRQQVRYGGYSNSIVVDCGSAVAMHGVHCRVV